MDLTEVWGCLLPRLPFPILEVPRRSSSTFLKADRVLGELA